MGPRGCFGFCIRHQLLCGNHRYSVVPTQKPVIFTAQRCMNKGSCPSWSQTGACEPNAGTVVNNSRSQGQQTQWHRRLSVFRRNQDHSHSMSVTKSRSRSRKYRAESTTVRLWQGIHIAKMRTEIHFTTGCDGGATENGTRNVGQEGSGLDTLCY